ncbi:MAG: phosphoglucosamine mutase [Desulfobacteraceae bacterium Eth-SRB2]|nr:MAG: phosphoglucosamine mutase [Desulfobacteraceae bacterium Eth-SRB2]
MGELFGTDGIRGVANQYPMTPEMAVTIGRAVAAIFKNDFKQSKIVLGKDTRISGDMLEYALVSGICSMGVDAYLTGILPTPGVAFMTSSTGANAGIVISASHNVYYDNGIKIFKGNGYKLSDEEEDEIEQLVFNKSIASTLKSVQDTGRVYEIEDAAITYGNFLKRTVPENYYFKDLKIVIDCSNGATFEVAPAIFSELGAKVKTLYNNPDGKNINDNCGSQHPESLKKSVVKNGADIGFAFDGDGDRLIAVDEKGTVATGDQILAVCAKFMKQKGLLKGNPVVSTVMSNMGLGQALEKMGIKHMTSKVGDRYVMEKMVSSGAILGGEDSGHMIFLNHHTTGDGILAALRLIEAMKEESKPLSELCKIMTVFPQVLINVDVASKPDLKNVPDIKDGIKSVETVLGKKGRVVIRYSGTQQVCRIMVEGPTINETRRYCRQLADIVKLTLGK